MLTTFCEDDDGPWWWGEQSDQEGWIFGVPISNVPIDQDVETHGTAVC
jgi:hypothetical protein